MHALKEFLDAGYRWAGHTLEVPGIVRHDQTRRCRRRIGATEYWVPDGDWISRNIHPFVREFLETHRAHSIQFGEDESFQSPDDLDESFEWLQVGPDGEPAMEPARSWNEGPRCWIDKLGFTFWDQVVAQVEQGFERV